MSEIKAADVAKLRKQTGAGMMDCKKALVEASGNFDAAIEVSRKKGQKGVHSFGQKGVHAHFFALFMHGCSTFCPFLAII